jgi:ribosomal protein S12 methylthiotransferase accessory factor
VFTNPVFKPHFRVQVLPGEGVFLSSELSQKVLLGSVFERVVPFVDGRSVAAICDAVTDLPPAKVFHAIGELDRRGYLAERDVSLSDPQAALFSLQGIAPELALSRLRNTVVPVRAVGDVDPSAVEALLRALQVRSEGEGTATLDLVVADSYLRSELAAINEAQLRLKRPWMLVRPGGPSACAPTRPSRPTSRTSSVTPAIRWSIRAVPPRPFRPRGDWLPPP